MPLCLVVALVVLLAAAGTSGTSATAPIEGTTYTSPQFGYRVTWQAPWTPGLTTSHQGDSDEFRLTAEGLYLEYLGIRTALGEADLVREFGTKRSTSYPGSTVRFQDPSNGLGTLAIVENIPRAGSTIDEIILALPVLDGERAVVRIFGTPPDFDPARRSQLGRMVSLDVSPRLEPVPPTISAASTVEGSPSPIGCDGASTWLSETLERNQAASELASRLAAAVPEDPSQLDPAPLSELAAEYESLAEAQAATVPPPAAEALNALLVDRLRKYGNGLRLLAIGIEEDDEPLAEQGADLMEEASLIGQQVPNKLLAFTQACGLEDDVDLDPLLACAETTEIQRSDWYKETRGGVAYVLALASGAEDADASAVRDAAEQVDGVIRDQSEAEPPAGAENMARAAAAYYETVGAALTAGAEGDRERMVTLLGIAEELEIEFEAAVDTLLARCAIPTSNQVANEASGSPAAETNPATVSLTPTSPLVPTATPTVGPAATLTEVEDVARAEATALACAETEQFLCAIDALEGVNKRHPDNQQVIDELYLTYVFYGLQREKNGDLSTARTYYEQAYDLVPARMEATEALDRIRPYARILFSDDFDGAPRFETQNSAESDVFYADGAFNFRMKTPDYTTWYWIDNVDVSGVDYAIAATVQPTAGASGSSLLYFGADRDGWSYVFQLFSAGGYANVARQHLGTGEVQWVLGDRYAATNYFAGAPDRMEVRVQDHEFRFLVNGVEIGSTRHAAYRPGLLGFGASKSSNTAERYFTVAFSDVTVYALDGDVALEPRGDRKPVATLTKTLRRDNPERKMVATLLAKATPTSALGFRGRRPQGPPRWVVPHHHLTASIRQPSSRRSSS